MGEVGGGQRLTPWPGPFRKDPNPSGSGGSRQPGGDFHVTRHSPFVYVGGTPSFKVTTCFADPAPSPSLFSGVAFDGRGVFPLF